MNFKDQWDTGMALQVLQSESVDSRTWAEAAKWLLLYGPNDIKQVLLQASVCATDNCFPQLTPGGFTENGEQTFDIASLADALGLDLETLLNSLADLEEETGFRLSSPEEEIFKIQ